ncbi:MAG: UPF0280 family protein [Promethearchaeota archaeon]
MPLQKYKMHFTVKESDVTIISEQDKYIRIALKVLLRERAIIEKIIRKYPKFQKTYNPYKIPMEHTPKIIKKMQDAAEICNVGPMAAVAGAIGDIMSETMHENGAEIAVVENGGEITIISTDDIHIALYSMTTVLKGQIGFLFEGGSRKMGVGTSSGTFGHAISLGQADTVTVFAESAAIGDAAATRIANEVKGSDIEGSIGKGLEIADSLDKISGTFITRSDIVGKSGNIPELISITGRFEDNFIKSKIEDKLRDNSYLF